MKHLSAWHNNINSLPSKHPSKISRACWPTQAKLRRELQTSSILCSSAVSWEPAHLAREAPCCCPGIAKAWLWAVVPLHLSQLSCPCVMAAWPHPQFFNHEEIPHFKENLCSLPGSARQSPGTLLWTKVSLWSFHDCSGVVPWKAGMGHGALQISWLKAKLDFQFAFISHKRCFQQALGRQ